MEPRASADVLSRTGYNLYLVAEGGDPCTTVRTNHKFFNRGITLFISDDERVRRIHRVLCRLDIGVAEIRSDGGGTE